MKKLCFLLLFFLSCKEKSNFTINGKFENTTTQSKVYLYGFEKNNAIALDSTFLSEKGEFKFTQSTKGVNFFKISVNENEYIIIAKNGDHIKIAADVTNKGMAYTISGADEANKLREINANKNKYATKVAEIRNEFNGLIEEAQFENRGKIQNQMSLAIAKETETLVNFILKFANDNPKSLSGFYAINSLNVSDYEKELIDYSDKIKSNFNNNANVKEFLIRMSKLKSVQIGQIAPTFSINSIDGKAVKLSDFKGQYVLLDFWASWCMPCRQENPNVVKAFNAHKNKNFTVFGIFL